MVKWILRWCWRCLPPPPAVGAGAGDRGAAASRRLPQHVRGPLPPLHGPQHPLQRSGVSGRVPPAPQQGVHVREQTGQRRPAQRWDRVHEVRNLKGAFHTCRLTVSQWYFPLFKHPYLPCQPVRWRLWFKLFFSDCSLWFCVHDVLKAFRDAFLSRQWKYCWVHRKPVHTKLPK